MVSILVVSAFVLKPDAGAKKQTKKPSLVAAMAFLHELK
jgi:hypothetical protein